VGYTVEVRIILPAGAHAAPGDSRRTEMVHGSSDLADDLKVVYTASGEMEAQGIRSMLEAAGIPVELRQEAAARLYAVTVDGLGAVRIVVPADRFEEAKMLIETPAVPLDDDE
jgi:hypothetical protein